MNLSLVTLALKHPRGAFTGAPGGSLQDTTKLLTDTGKVAHDTLAGAAGQLRDTIGAPPLPGGVAAIVRLIFGVPRWLQIGGAVVGAIVALAVVVWLWRVRATIFTWLRTRSKEIQFTLAGLAMVVLVVAAFAGKTSWDYMQHDNGFCTGCHVMEHPFDRFAIGAGKHKDRKCHECHQQSIFASTRQLVLWVANRPTEIGKHAPVPNERCIGCHQLNEVPASQGGRKQKAFEHVMYTAGHKAHFASDSSSLKDLKCVKCHGAEVHKFIPSARTCQQSGCHTNQHVKLAGMAKLPEINCVTCHAFTADLAPLADRDSAVRALVPAKDQCRSCHQMDGKPKGYVLAKDPHKGSCGSCHDVHKDLVPADARTSCVTCHKNLASSAFHQGKNHQRVAKDCLTCHNPHSASLDASDCVGCHAAVRARGKFKPPMPFDTSAVIKRRIAATQHVAPAPLSGQSNGVTVDESLPDHRGKGDAMPEELPPTRDSPGVAAVAASLPDTFPHGRHTSLPCLTCHTVNGPKNGLVFEVPRGCDLCHHQSLMAGKVEPADCARCHKAEKLAVPKPMVLQVKVGNRAPTPRTVGFKHDGHQRLPCATCHKAPNTVPPDSVRTCQACHDQHHTAQRNCSTCHNRPETPAAHSRTTHVACDACHTPSRIAVLSPSRNFCVTCHAAQKNHQPGGECSTCHFLEAPADYRKHLMKSGVN